jgi:transcriptional regulator with XRE-family HTH domain
MKKLENKKLNFSETIQTWRPRIRQAGKTEEEAAKESGLLKSQLSRYLNQRYSPGLKKFEQFENYLRGLGV